MLKSELQNPKETRRSSRPGNVGEDERDTKGFFRISCFGLVRDDGAFSWTKHRGVHAHPRFGFQSSRSGYCQALRDRVGRIGARADHNAVLRGIHEALNLQVAIPYAGECGDVTHEGWTDVDLAVLTHEYRLAVIAGVIHLDTDGMPFAGYDLKHKFWIAHRVAVLLAVVGHGYQLTAARPGADIPDNQPQVAGYFQAGRAMLERF